MAERMKTGERHTIPECCGGSDCAAQIREHMDVLASCGKKVGVVDHVEGDMIKLTRKDSPDGQHHLIPTGWVAQVDQQVHLNRNSEETERDWKPAPAGGTA